MATQSSFPTPAANTTANTGVPGQPLLREGGAEGLVRIIKVDSSTGCTLTNASIKGLTPLDFEALANKEIDLARVIANSAEAKILGVQERGMATLLNSAVTNIKPLINKQNISEQSIILPYIQRRQRSHINANYFTVVAGEIANGSSKASYSTEALQGAGTTAPSNTGHADDWVVSVTVGSSDWASETSLKEDLTRYFLPGSFVIISGWDVNNANAKTAVDVQYQIMGSQLTSGSTVNADVTLRPVGIEVDNAGQLGTPGSVAASKFGMQAGIMQTIANNVSDYEAWCRNQPTDLSVKLVVNWLQTTRESRIVDDKYKETLAKVLNGDVNPFMQSMSYHPLAEQNKIASQLSQDQWTRATWFNKALSSKQQPETYMELPPVNDPELELSGGTCHLEYKANALGIQTLLEDSNRISDKVGGNLDLDSLFKDLYYLKRNREADGDQIQVIDCMTDRITADKIFQVMNQFYKSKYGWEVHRNADIGKTIEHNGIMLFNYNIYDIPEIGVQLAVFHDPFFDDLINVAGYNNLGSTDAWGGDANTDMAASAFRQLWLLDWSDIKIGVAGTKSVTRKNPHPDVMESYKCRMDAVIKEYNLRSTRWTTLLDRPARHLLIRNFKDVVTVTASPVTGSGSAATGTQSGTLTA